MTILSSVKTIIPCERCGTTERIVTKTDDGFEQLCVFCMIRRYKEGKAT